MNETDEGGLYPHFDIDCIWSWLIAAIKRASTNVPISKICIATHGAAAALVELPERNQTNGLVLPVLDYEWDGVREFDEEYDRLRPVFGESFSPALSAGLNLGRQLFWQSKRYAAEFDQAHHILPYAQYWSWRLSGVAVSEVSALGCHTDLWAPGVGEFSSLVARLGWRDKFAPLAPASREIGSILPSVAEETGLSPECKVLAGVHDSNASYARFLGVAPDERPTVVSAGTWAVTMHPGGDLLNLDERRDMLANVDVEGAPVACARFMGGREYAEICRRIGSSVDEACSLADVKDVIEDGVFALPDFSNGSGPFGGREGEILGTPQSASALASLYSALMIDVELDLLDSNGLVVIEGSFADNAVLCSLVATLRKGQKISRLSGVGGVAQGCFALANWADRASAAPTLQDCIPAKLSRLDKYRNAWRRQCEIHERIYA